MRGICQDYDSIPCQFSHNLLGAMGGAVIVKQDCGLVGTSRQLRLCSNDWDEYLLYLLIEKFGIHVRNLPNFELQVNVLSDTLLKRFPRFWTRSDKERGICISRCRDTTNQNVIADRSVDWITKS
jgi:hypothetical protein